MLGQLRHGQHLLAFGDLGWLRSAQDDRTRDRQHDGQDRERRQPRSKPEALG